MKIFLISDVHFEFHNKIDWLPPLPAGDQFDVLVLAGDIGFEELPCGQISTAWI